MTSRKLIAFLAVFTVAAFLTCLFVGSNSLAAPQEEKKADIRNELIKMMSAKSETITVGKSAKPTDFNFRLTVTIEDNNKSSIKVLDSVFNQHGDLVYVRTADAHLAQIIKTNISKGSIDQCYKRCRHHLDSGNAPKYATCFYACLAAP